MRGNINFTFLSALCRVVSFVGIVGFVGSQGIQKMQFPIPDKWVLSVLSVLSLVREAIKWFFLSGAGTTPPLIPPYSRTFHKGVRNLRE